MFNQEESATFARDWDSAVRGDSIWAEDIEKSVKATKVYRNRPLVLHKHKQKLNDIKQSIGMASTITVVNKDPYSVLLDMFEKYGDKKSICILNDGSYFKPAGGFLKGNQKPEERLCRVSGLYQVLEKCKRFEERENMPATPAEYRSEIIYTPDIPFTRESGMTDAGIINADVISCASPNCNKVPLTRMEQYEDALRARIEGIYVMPALHGAKVLILTSWGCGMHKNNPEKILEVFDNVIAKYGRLYNEIVFAIPNEEVYKIFSTPKE